MKKITVIMLVALMPHLLFAQEKKTVTDFETSKKIIKKTKPIVIMQKAKVKQTLKITSHTDGQDAYGAVQILGTGEPGLRMQVSLYGFAEVTPKKGRSVWETFKMITLPTSTYSEIKKELTQKSGASIKERYFDTYKVNIDKNGKWYIPVFQSFGSVDWVRSLFIPFAWVVIATAEDPNYREGNYVNIRLGCKL